MNIGRKYEKSRKNKGRLTVGSGNRWYDKGDQEKDQFLVELKATKHASFSVTKTHLAKIQAEAAQKNKYWAMLINIDGEEVLVTSGSWLDVLDEIAT